MKHKKYFISLMLICLAGNSISQPVTRDYPVQLIKEFHTSEYPMKYLLNLPDGYNSKDSWPLLIFLHGMGERGDDIELVKMHGPPKIAIDMNLPFIIISPQCPEGKFWENKPLMELIESILSEFPVNRNKIYLTGLSMGGFGTWNLAAAFPELFAAIVPICGGGDSSKACNLKDIPTWVFHGDVDGVVPIGRSQEMVEAIENCGGNVKFTIYKNTGHDSWTETYANPKLYEWLLNQSKVN